MVVQVRKGIKVEIGVRPAIPAILLNGLEMQALSSRESLPGGARLQESEGPKGHNEIATTLGRGNRGFEMKARSEGPA
jgi:hypothetical protein